MSCGRLSRAQDLESHFESINKWVELEFFITVTLSLLFTIKVARSQNQAKKISAGRESRRV